MVHADLLPEWITFYTPRFFSCCLSQDISFRAVAYSRFKTTARCISITAIATAGRMPCGELSSERPKAKLCSN